MSQLKSATSDERQPQADTHPYEEYPLLTHERLLGVDISVNQAEIQCELAGVDYPLAKSPEPVKIDAVGTDKTMITSDRRYIARWARRNLFDGAGPK